MRHVYIGWCGGGVTKWVTAKPWNGTLHEVDGVPCDAQGRVLLEGGGGGGEEAPTASHSYTPMVTRGPQSVQSVP